MHAITAVSAATSVAPTLVENVVAFVLINFGEPLTLKDLAAAAGMSRFKFCRRFQRAAGVSPMRWLWRFRTALAAELISLDPHWTLTDVAFTCGFTSSAHFSRTFKAMFRQSPSEYRQHALAAFRPERQIGSFEALFTTQADVVRRAAESTMHTGKKLASW